MHIEDLVKLAGGINNVYRVLLPEGHLSLAVRDPDLVDELPAGTVLRQVIDEWHLLDLSDDSVAEESLFRIGREIEASQRENIRQFSHPTSCQYRPAWHIAGPQGLINDPNGFIYHQGEYHLYYQWSPVGCSHTDKYWVHTTSKDLLNWEWDDVALTPSDWFDSHGAYSGHAVSLDHELMVFYTGNTRLGEERHRQTMQCAAVSEDGKNLRKLGPLIRDLPPGVTEHIRDPKIIHRDGRWLMFLGAQTTEMKGRLAVYHSEDLHHWEFDRLYGDELGDYGYMWECPDIFEIDGQYYLVFSPQGVDSGSPLNTVPHQNRIAHLTFGENDEVILSHLQPLDYGFDFYAPQSLQTEDGRRVMCGWMGLPDEWTHPSCRSGHWVHQLTALRELSVKNGKLIQKPQKELEKLYSEVREYLLEDSRVDLKTKTFELRTQLAWGSRLRLFEDTSFFAELYLDAEKRCLLFDRSHTQLEEGDTAREIQLDSGVVDLQILADNSSLEVFINGGEAVMTARIFTPEGATQVSVKGKATLQVCELKVPEMPYLR
ncbi:Sucrose-6-phosphate hydrolase [Vibrio aerogenes CECT 7868]|uniref:Sucrose-6-phosphate hydrolase n=1 Tax=Vibrio aerogenes CECT 7868 TaxID=1216006 RepID=A0A1M6C926_9VIBR|nr:glycoside hydrolase family 32 protein [Vibrio aerogenes]SHI57505.1 Sucrose-6-phosphate hydrolase [Vibrio aerogenes CECT 7868]